MTSDHTHHPDGEYTPSFLVQYAPTGFWRHIKPISVQRTTESIKRAVRKFCCSVTTKLFVSKGTHGRLRGRGAGRGGCALPVQQLWLPWDKRGRGLQQVPRFTASPRLARDWISCAPTFVFWGYLLNKLYPESFLSSLSYFMCSIYFNGDCSILKLFSIKIWSYKTFCDYLVFCHWMWFTALLVQAMIHLVCVSYYELF